MYKTKYYNIEITEEIFNEETNEHEYKKELRELEYKTKDESSSIG
ncbi:MULTISPECIES: hypothetical protein [unclassified Clostridium]|nr:MULTISPECIES: hypothetical protein [unclassified Clostridium]